MKTKFRLLRHMAFPLSLSFILFTLFWNFLWLEDAVAHTPVAPVNTVAATCDSVTDIPLQECQALETLFNSTNGNGWIIKTGWLQSASACSWFGVSCVNGHVAKLELSQNGLTGSIPPHIEHLTELTQLSLVNNQLSGNIPASLGSLANLAILGLGLNQLSGPIPAEINNLTQLTRLSLYQNQLNGEIPALDKLQQLEILSLSANHLTGSIPESISNLSNLKIIGLNQNQLIGSIPASLGSLSKLTQLVLADNRLSGEIPSQLGDLANLVQLILWRNQLTGSIPVTLGKLTNLEILQLYENQLTGSIPSGIGDLTKLTKLALGVNQLSGPIPAGISNLTELTHFSLYNNQLSGTIPDLAKLQKLELLSLGDNQLSGPIPTSIGTLTHLKEIGLNHNRLSGPIPASLGNLKELTNLTLASNQLSGEIPATLGSLPNLQYLRLWRNQLTGNIPVALGNLTNLQILHLYENRLTGTIPQEIGNLTKLTELVLALNQLSGEIPPALGNLSNLTLLNLWHNQLTGGIPTRFGDLTSLQRLYLAENKLTGAIPSTLGQLSKLTLLHLWQNQLTDSLPVELGNLSNLQELRIDVNALNGALPRELTALKLVRFYFDGTKLCEPKSESVQNWLGSIRDLKRNNLCLTDITIDKSATPGEVALGVTVSVRITLTTDAITAITLTETMPISLTYVPGSATGGLIYKATARQLVYDATIIPDNPLVFTYQALVESASLPGSIFSMITHIDGAGAQSVEKSAMVVIPNEEVGSLVLLYVVADNDLGDEAIRLINNAEKAASLNPTIATAVMLDIPGKDNALLYYLKPDPLELTCPNYRDSFCKNRYELGVNVFSWPDDPANPNSLSAFIIQSIKAHPNVKRVILSLVGHGSGWSPYLYPGQPSGLRVQPGGLLLDQQPENSLSTAGVREALQMVHKETGKTIALLYLDACSMAMTEVAYELAGSANYLLASESLSWAAFPYDDFLTAINDSVTDEKIGQRWIEIGGETLQKHGGDYPFTLSLINLQEISAMAQKQNTLVATLRSLLVDPTAKEKLAAAIQDTQCFDSNYDGAIDLDDTYCDLYNFTSQLSKQFSEHPEVMQAAQQLQSTISGVVKFKDKQGGKPWFFVNANHWNFDNVELGGLSIYMPLKPRRDESQRRYYHERQLKWANDTNWDEFLGEYWGGQEPPTTTIDSAYRTPFKPLPLQPTVKIRPERKESSPVRVWQPI